MLSANSLRFEDNSYDESLIDIVNNNRPRIKSWERPTLTSDQTQTCSFNKILCFLFLKKLHKRICKLPDVSFVLI